MTTPPNTAQRRVWDVYYEGNGASNRLAAEYIARLNGTALGGNADWTNDNINQIDLHNTDSFFDPTAAGDPDNTNYNNNFVANGSDQSEKYAQVRADGNIRINNIDATKLPDANEYTTGGLAADITGITAITNGYRLELGNVRVYGTIDRGDNIRIGINPNREQIEIGQDDVIGLVSALDGFVKRTDLEGHESDLFASWSPTSVFFDPLTTYRSGAWGIATNTNGAPTASDTIAATAITSGPATIYFGRLRTDSDGNGDVSFTLGPALAAADYPVGTIRHVSGWDPYDPENHLLIT